nr:hypothetical protein [Tanacetum cinerariifolium]
MSLFRQDECGCGQPCDTYFCYSCTCPRCGRTLSDETCNNCMYGNGEPIMCIKCGGMLRGGFFLTCDINDQNSYNYDPNAYSFNNSNYFSQLQDENYLCNFCGNNSHDDYDCQQQFPFVYEQEPSYNQNYDNNYYPHESLSFPCCDYCGGSHETFQCQPDNQNIEFFGSDQIQTPQYLDDNPPSPEIKYDQSTSTNHPIFLNSDEGHSVQDKESLENPFNEIADNESDLEPEATTDTELSSAKDIHPLAVQESPQDFDICQLIREEYSIKVPEEQKQKIENTMLELVKICQEKELLCIHDDINDLIESALDSKLLLINLNSQRLDKKEQEVKKVEEQPVERRNQIPKSKFDFEEEIRLIENLLFDNSFPRPPELNAEFADTIIESIPLPIPVQDGNSQQEEIDVVTKTDDVLPPSDDNDDDYDPLLGEADLFLSENSIPPGIENVADDPEGDVHFLEELLIDDFILSHELSDSNFEDNPSISRPPTEPPDDNFDLEPVVISAVMEDIDEPDEHFNQGGEIFVSTNNEDVDYFPFMFVIQIFLPYLILPEISPLLLFAESEDTIFDP